MKKGLGLMINALNQEHLKHPKFPIRGKDFLYAVLIALISAVFIDYLASSILGAILCIILGICIIWISFRNFRKAIDLFLFVVLLSPVFPRKLIDLRASAEEVVFNSFTAFNVFGISIVIWVIVGLLLVALAKSKFSFPRSHHILVRVFKFKITLIACMYIATFIGLFLGQELILKEFISDHRFFVMLIGGIFVSAFYVKDDVEDVEIKLTKLLLIVALSIGIRSIFFFLKDRAVGELNIDFSSLPFFMFPVAFAALQTYKNSINLVLVVIVFFLGAFSIGRLEFVLGIFLGFLFIAQNIIKRDVLKSLRIIVVLGVIAIIAAVSIYSNKRVLDFIIFKASTTVELFADEGAISKSPKVRLDEMKSIFMEESENLLPLIIGKGFGSSYAFQYDAGSFDLDESDYSERELKSGRFYRPHTFIAYTFLKGGVLYFAFYMYLLFSMWLASWRQQSGSFGDSFMSNFGLYYTVFAINMYWQGQQVFMFGFFLLLILLRNPKSIKMAEHNECL